MQGMTKLPHSYCVTVNNRLHSIKNSILSQEEIPNLAGYLKERVAPSSNLVGRLVGTPVNSSVSGTYNLEG